MEQPPAEQRYFTVEEANASLEVIRPLMDQVMQLRQEILDSQQEDMPVVEKAAGNGGNQEASRLVPVFDRLDAIVRQILATGAIFRDVNSGLVDFLSWRDGREVYLCWQYGEEKVAYWHELDTGFAGRQPL